MAIYEENISGLEIVNFTTYKKEENVRCPVCLKYSVIRRLYSFTLDSNEKPVVSNDIIYKCVNPACLISYFRLV